jgi:biotin carboxyl carrier protein
MLCGDVGARAGWRSLLASRGGEANEAGDRGDVHDRSAAALGQHSRASSEAVRDATEIDVDRRHPIPTGDTGVVHHDIETVERFDRRSERAIDRVLVGHIEGAGGRVASSFSDASGSVFGSAGVEIGAVDRCTLGGEAEADRAPDARAGAGHQRRAPFEASLFHRCPPHNVSGRAYRLEVCLTRSVQRRDVSAREKGETRMDVVAEWPGVVTELKVSVGATVAADDELLVLESMKMLTPVVAPAAGVVAEIAVEAEQYVEEGALLLRLD